MHYQEVIHFWFNEIEPKFWFAKDVDFDQMLRDRFLAVHEAAARGELSDWRTSAEGRLAEVIVLDQFSRNMFRDSPGAFINDVVSLVLSQTAVAVGDDQRLAPEQRAFLYMPYMHSESPAIHKAAEQLFKQPGLERNLEFEIKHKAIIDRFGRFPHRNEILGRESTPEETEFLRQPDSSF